MNYYFALILHKTHLVRVWTNWKWFWPDCALVSNSMLTRISRVGSPKSLNKGHLSVSKATALKIHPLSNEQTSSSSQFTKGETFVDYSVLRTVLNGMVLLSVCVNAGLSLVVPAEGHMENRQTRTPKMVAWGPRYLTDNLFPSLPRHIHWYGGKEQFKG